MTLLSLKDNELEPNFGSGNYFSLSSNVGREAFNDRADVIKAQTLLGHAGYIDLEPVKGPTGWYGKPLELGIRRYQKDNGLTVDGVMLPGGETIRSLERDYGSAFQKFAAPSPDIVDQHHDRLARGDAGLLETRRFDGTPYGVKLMGSDKESRPSESVDQIAQLKLLRPGLLPGPLAPPKVPVIPWRRRKQPLERYDDFLAQNRIALHEGVRDIFGDIAERHETDNTRLSSNIIVQECNEVIKERVKPEGYNFEQEGGATPGGRGGKDMPERALKDGEKGGGGGHSFPDVLYMDGEKIVAINSATESRPGEYIRREVKSFDRLMQNVGEWVAKITGKKRPDESEDDYRARARQICEEAFGDFLNKELGKSKQAGEPEAETSDQAVD